jgi:hypothetical protein
MFQQEIDTLKKSSTIFESKTSKHIQELTKQFESQKQIQSELEIKHLQEIEDMQRECREQLAALEEGLQLER